MRKISWKAIALVIAVVLVCPNTVFATEKAAVEDSLSPPLSLQTDEFRDSYAVAAICRSVEQNVLLEDKRAIDNICAWIQSSPAAGIRITRDAHEVTIDIPAEGLAVRYFLPGKAHTVVPYNDVSRLTTKVITRSGLCRQIICRTKTLGNANAFTETDRRHITELLDYADREIAAGRLLEELPIVARMVDDEGRVLLTVSRIAYEDDKEQVRETRGLHAEIATIREAEKRGFTDWGSYTLYVDLAPCHNCTKAITEFYGFKRVVYGIDDEGLAPKEQDRNNATCRINNVNITRCDDTVLLDRLRNLFEKQREALDRSEGLGVVTDKILDLEQRLTRSVRTWHRSRYGEDIQVCVFDADTWAENKDAVEGTEALMMRHLKYIKQNLNPRKRQVLIVYGAVSNIDKAKEAVFAEDVFDETETVFLTDDLKVIGTVFAAEGLEEYLRKTSLRPEAGGTTSSGDVPGAQLVNFEKYLGMNMDALANMFGEEKQDILLRLPVEAVETAGSGNIRMFLDAVTRAPNVYVEFYYMSGIGEKVPSSIYTKYGVRKKELPDTFKKTRANTLTLLPVLKGEEITDVTVLSRLGDPDIRPIDTVLSPIGLQNDAAGLIRSMVLGIRIMGFARELEENETLETDPEFLGRVQVSVMEIYKQVCDPSYRKDLAGLTPQDIIALATGNTINDILKPLQKLVKLLPMAPIDAEELRLIYERAREVVLAA